MYCNDIATATKFFCAHVVYTCFVGKYVVGIRVGEVIIGIVILVHEPDPQILAIGTILGE